MLSRLTMHTHLALPSTGFRVSCDLVDGALDFGVLADFSKIAPSLSEKSQAGITVNTHGLQMENC